MEWLKDLKKEELPETYQNMLRVLVEGDEEMSIKASIPDPLMALQAVIALSVYYNKQGFYFSGIDDVVKQKKREFVIRWQGKRRVAELARITELAERSIYSIYEELQRNKQRDLFQHDGAKSA